VKRYVAQLHDRSVFCTAALTRYLGYQFSAGLVDELTRSQQQRIFENRVFLVRNLGFVTPSPARRITLEEMLRFEKIHDEVYREFGFEVVYVEPGPLIERVAVIKAAVHQQPRGVDSY